MSAVAFQVRFADRRSEISLAAFAALVAALAFAPWWAGRDDLHLLGEVFAYSTTSEEWPGFESTPGFLGVAGDNVPTEWDVRNGDRM